jgi:hypothetical protein
MLGLFDCMKLNYFRRFRLTPAIPSKARALGAGTAPNMISIFAGHT